MNSPAVILRLNDNGPDQRIQAIAAPLRKNARLTPKAVIAARWLGGGGGDGISSNMTLAVYSIFNTTFP